MTNDSCEHDWEYKGNIICTYYSYNIHHCFECTKCLDVLLPDYFNENGTFKKNKLSLLKESIECSNCTLNLFPTIW